MASIELIAPTQHQSSRFVDISSKQDGSILKRVLQAGTVDFDPSNGDYVQFYLAIIDDPDKPCREKIRVSYLCFGKPGNSEDLETTLKSMQQGEVAEFRLCEIQQADEMYATASNQDASSTNDVDIDPEQVNTQSEQKRKKNSELFLKIDMIGLFQEDISKNKDKGVLRFRLKSGEGSSSPNDGANVHCHLVAYLLEGIKLEERDVEFTLGEGGEVGIPRGIEFALMQMKLYEKSRFVIKRPYAFKKEVPESIGKLMPEDYEELIYEIRLNKFENAKEVWELGNEDRLKAAKAYKEKGTNYFRRQAYDMAIKFYGKVVYYLGPTPENQHFKQLNEEKNQVLLAGYLNLAQTFLNEDKPFDAIKNCDLALQIDPDNVKAHFRKGLAHVKCKEFDLANGEFERVIQLDAGNRAAVKELALCRQHIRAQKDKERSTFKNMFDKFADVDKALQHTEEEKQKDVWRELSMESDFRTPEGDRFSDLPIKMIQ